MKIIGTGLSGLVGSRIVELLGQDFEFEDISRRSGIDITDRDGVFKRLGESSSEIVLHLAAYTNVDGAEEQKTLGEESDAWKVNVTGTRNVIDACLETGKKIIFFSTDFVFDGQNTPVDGYSEDDMPHPINWYARTKYEAEKIVQDSNISWVIARIAYPYRAHFEKNDFFRAMKNRLTEDKPIAGVVDHTFCPTFIDDVAYALQGLIGNDARGIYHMTGSNALSPYEGAMEIADMFGLDKNLISQTTREEYFKDKAPRPFDLSMNNAKIKQLGVKMRGFQEGLEEIKRQLEA